jgi:hypothetical protein
LLEHCGESIQSIRELTVNRTDKASHSPRDEVTGAPRHSAGGSDCSCPYL